MPYPHGILKRNLTPLAEMNCEECSSSFEKKKESQRFCSERCRRKAEARRGRARKAFKGKECRRCNSVFLPEQGAQAFCSDSCRLQSQAEKLNDREMKRKEAVRRKVRDCVQCGKEFNSPKGAWTCSKECRTARNSHKARLGQYGLTEAQFQAMPKACEICGGKEDLHIDHCHAGGHVRGMLCFHCNHGLGMFKDSVENLSAAIEYLS